MILGVNALPDPLFWMVIAMYESKWCALCCEVIKFIFWLPSRNKHISTYPYAYPRELLILSNFMFNTWFSCMLHKMNGCTFEERDKVLTMPKQISRQRIKKPPGNHKKMKHLVVSSRKLQKKQKKSKERMSNKALLKLGMMAALNVVAQCPKVVLASDREFCKSLRKYRSNQGILRTEKIPKDKLPRLRHILTMDNYEGFIEDNSMYHILCDSGA